MPYRRNYPRTVSEVVDPAIKFRPAALRAVRALARSKPWRGTPEERMQKIGDAAARLAAAYEIQTPRLQFVRIGRAAGNGFYDPATHTIGLIGRLSIVTFLHEFAHARGMDERRACRWSINMFRRVFPRSYARCRHEGHRLTASVGRGGRDA